MGVRRVEELLAYRLSVEFRRAAYELVRQHPAAYADVRYRGQLFDAAGAVAANVSEGFGRRTAREFRQFLSYARSSAAEARTWIEDGVDRGHFTHEAAEPALSLCRRSAAMIARLQRSLRPFTDAD